MSGIKSTISLVDNVSSSLNKISMNISSTISAFEHLSDASDSAVSRSNIDAASNAMRQFQLDIDKATDEIEQMNNKLRSSGSEVSSFGSTFKGMLASAAVQKVGDVLLDQAKSAVQYASDLNESQNVVDVTFGESAESINKFAKTTINQFGLSELSAKRYAGTIGAMMKSSGLSGSEITSMSEEIVGLTGDMASFYNLDSETAFEKIRSGISGETEPLKQLGINMSVANLEAYAMSQGITESYNSMSQAEQTMLRYNYLITATSDSQGDFARTSGSLANSVRNLQQSWEQFSGTIATQVIPVFEQILSAIDTFTSAFGNSSESATNTGKVIAVVVAGIWNTIAFMVNNVITSFVTLQNIVATFANFFGNVFDNPAVAIAHLFVDLFTTITNIVSNAAKYIDNMLGTDYAGGIADFNASVEDWVDSKVGKQKTFIEKWDVNDYYLKGVSLKSAWTGNSASNDAVKKIEQTVTNTGNKIGDKVDKVNDNTEKIADSLDITSQSIKYIKDYAEQRAINRYTGTTVNVEMTNNNNVSSDADIDGIARRLVEVINTEVAAGMEGAIA